MPYIKPPERQHLDYHIYNLAQRIRDGKAAGAAPGQLNYAITGLVTQVIGPELNYLAIALVTGILENVKQEFYRRVATPYEDAKSRENGDVYD